MRKFSTALALGIAGLLLGGSASADYSFSFNTQGRIDHTGASGGNEVASLSEDLSATGSLGDGGDGGLSSLSSLGRNYLTPPTGAAAGGDSALDCVDSTSVVADAPRSTQACWLVALAAYDNKFPLTDKATDAYPIVGGQDLSASYPPNGFGGTPGSGPSGDGGTPSSDNRGTGSGGSAGASTASNPDDRNTSPGHSTGDTSDPFHFHTGSDGRGGDIVSLGPTQSSAGGTDSISHHHHGGSQGGGGTTTSPSDTSTSLIDTLVASTGDVAPVHHHSRDPIFTTTTGIVGATVTSNPVIDLTSTGPSANITEPAADPIPEPGTLVLVGLALVGIAVVPRRKRR